MRNMILRTPDYFDQFHCTADRCPRNCCEGWEVVVDDGTAAFFQTVPGPFGDRLRAALTRDADGERCMVRQDRRCPFLDGRNLCEVYRKLGPEHTGFICRTHPRFTEDFGPLREISLSASCPETARLLLASHAPLTFTEWETAERGTEPDDWLAPLLICRRQALAILEDRSRPWRERCAWFLLLANDAQALLDDDRAGELEELSAAFSDLPRELPEELRPAGQGLFPAALEELERLEILEDDWRPLVRAAKDQDGVLPDWALERMSCYFLFRYFLRTVNDGDLLSRAELAVLAPLCAERLSGGAATAEAALYRLCRELEHDRDNLTALQRALCRREDLSLTRFFAELKKRL